MYLFHFVVLAFLFTSEAHKSSNLEPNCNGDKFDVLILGAGVAGLTAARLLRINGIDNFKILEGGSEIGGRIKKGVFGGRVIEYGANWIHNGPRSPHSITDTDNPLWILARDEGAQHHLCGRKHKLRVVKTDRSLFMDRAANQSPYTVVPSPLVSRLSRVYSEALDAAIASAKLTPTPTQTVSVKDGLRNFGWKPNKAPRKHLKQSLEWSKFDFGHTIGTGQSSLELMGLEPEAGYDYMVTDQDGYVSILNCIAHGLNNDSGVNKVSLNSKVSRIKFNNECVCAEGINSNNADQVWCGKYGILTFSIGVIQNLIRNKLLVITRQPKVDAINNSRMGLYLKIFVLFTEDFEVLPEGNNDYIYRTISNHGDYQVIQPIQRNIILMTIVGNAAAEALQKDKYEVQQDIETALIDWFGPMSVPKIEDIDYKDWLHDPHFLGTYTTYPLSLSAHDKLELLKPEGNLYFSGEATSFLHSGTVHGAYCSGLDTAASIINEINSSSVLYSPLPYGYC